MIGLADSTVQIGRASVAERAIVLQLCCVLTDCNVPPLRISGAQVSLHVQKLPVTRSLFVFSWVFQIHSSVHYIPVAGIVLTLNGRNVTINKTPTPNGLGQADKRCNMRILFILHDITIIML